MALRKEILRRRGWIESAYVRPPATTLDSPTLDSPTLDDPTVEELRQVLTAVVDA